ncbi:ABC transporter substrate-binding protein [Parafilimonas sp.]|uniref:ABC transporter substrate-binding protein n=1 Tax=Parafilimonas sp. TaxID=1969739 RepID=UPI0039E40A36
MRLPFMHSAIKKMLPALLFVFITGISKAADTTHAPLRIAVLLPLNLDSAFNGYEYNLSNVRIPQYFLSGLDFYSGVMMAIDSLQKENANIEVWIYDTHKAGQSMDQLTVQMQPMNFALVVASISSSTEQRALTSFSARNSIPVISATFPNDIYLENNPFFILVNPTWKTHVQAIYNYLANNYRGKKIVFFTRRGSLEDKISEELKLLNARRALNFSTIILRDNFSAADVLSRLDSTTQNIVLCGSLYEKFGQALIKTLNDNGETYSSVVAGMPTWNGMDGTTGQASDKIQIVVTTPYNYVRGGAFIDSISANYMRAYYTKPSDMVYKGYETMYHFARLLLVNPDSFINNISRDDYTVSNNYSFEPVRLTQTSFLPDYLENKKLYYIKIINGSVTIN